MHELIQQIAQAVGVVRSHWSGKARVGIILGTGLGSVAAHISAEAQIDYAALPHFPQSTAIGHAGQLVCGTLQGVPVVAMEGRFHAYEGYSYKQITFPVRVMKALGADTLIVSNACGGLNPQFALGDIMVLEDHLNLMNGNPLIGPNDDALGPRFPDLCRPYDPVLIQRALEIARREKFAAHRGVYAAVVGPNLETRAEYRALQTLGADAVGMSTVPEVLVAVHSGMRVLGLSVITDMCLPETLKPAVIEEILKVAASAEPKLRAIVLGILAQEDKSPLSFRERGRG
jgi:purine-nucleoside phosphorylase